jgi:membrane-associated phospholipid phosphatase
MAKELYDSVKVVTPRKRDIALFWADNPVATGTPGFHWISVVNQMIGRRHLTADEAAELYTLTSMAIADAFIGCWKEKYHSMVVRPVAYFQRVFDPKWTALFATPPFPEYPSGHSTISAAAARVLVRELGDSIPFVDSSQVDIGFAPRPFRSFTEARDEVAISRVYGGIHYVPSVMNGITQGDCIGNRVLHKLDTRKKRS